jgi:hypothetical protein
MTGWNGSVCSNMADGQETGTYPQIAPIEKTKPKSVKMLVIGGRSDLTPPRQTVT